MKPQTAIRGVFSVAVINVLARVVGYGKHVVITAYIGLSAQLDAYYVAFTILSLAIMAFGDVFDSLGIPQLVKTHQEKGEESFRSLAGSILAFACILSLCLFLLLCLIAPWTPLIAPGFTPEKRDFVLRNLYFLAPMALLYLPYHAIGSFLRAKRRFRDFYIGDFLVASVSLAVLYFGRERPYIIPASLSIGYAAVFVYIVLAGKRHIRLTADFRSGEMRGIFRMFFQLIPLYMTFYLFPLIDRAFASYLPSGGISALSYGLLIALIPSSIAMMENVFITPLTESREKSRMMVDILSGVLILAVPVAFFMTAYAHEIIKVGLERGVFTSASTEMTATALAFFSPAIPAFFFWPICYRLFQIMEKLKAIGAIAIVAILCNAALNLLFMNMGMGIKGLAIATTIANYTMIGGAAILLRRHGITLFSKNVLSVFLLVAGICSAVLLLTYFVPPDKGTAIGLASHAILFFGATALAVYWIPNKEVRYWRDTVLKDLRSRNG